MKIYVAIVSENKSSVISHYQDHLIGIFSSESLALEGIVSHICDNIRKRLSEKFETEEEKEQINLVLKNFQEQVTDLHTLHYKKPGLHSLFKRALNYKKPGVFSCGWEASTNTMYSISELELNEIQTIGGCIKS